MVNWVGFENVFKQLLVHYERDAMLDGLCRHTVRKLCVKKESVKFPIFSLFCFASLCQQLNL